LKVSANVKIAMLCFEIFGGANSPNAPPPWLRAWFMLSFPAGRAKKLMRHKIGSEKRADSQMSLAQNVWETLDREVQEACGHQLVNFSGAYARSCIE